MSATGPNVYIGVGDTDWWDVNTSYLQGGLSLDSRLRRIKPLAIGGGATSMLGAGTRTASVVPKFAQYRLIAAGVSGGNQFGLFDTSKTFDPGLSLGSQVGSVCYNRGGAIQLDGSTLETATVWADGMRIGLALYVDKGSEWVQFYINGTSEGDPVLLASGKSWRLGCTMNDTADREACLDVDRDDLPELPAGHQAWGAAARIADAGGYSPPASLITDVHASVAVDAYKKTAWGNAASSSTSARATSAARADDRLYYAEFAIAVRPPSGGTQTVGVLARTAALSTNVGGNSLGWGYQSTGQTRHNAVNLSGYVTYNTGDRVGVIWHPPTGKLWFTRNATVINGGSPQFGSTPHYSNAFGDLLPGATPGGGFGTGRVRFCLHPREQLYRPSYCVAWDIVEMLPEQHYAGRLSSDAEITQRLHLPMWGGRGKSGTVIGSIDVANQDGYYDALYDIDLRDQALSIYEYVPSLRANDWLIVCNVDSLAFQEEKTLRILSRGADSYLDKRIVQPIFALGEPWLVPASQRQAQALAYDVSHTPLMTLNVLDKGDPVTSWRLGSATLGNGFIRTVNPAGKQSAQIHVYRRESQIALTNAGFDAWVADNPSGWTITETAPNALVTQNGTAARFLRNPGAANCRAAQGFITRTDAYLFAARVVVTAYTSGDLKTGVDMAGFGVQLHSDLGITGVGEYWSIFSHSTVLPANGNFLLHANDTTNLTVDFVELIRIETTAKPASAVKYLLEEVAALASTRYLPLTDTFLAAYKIGFWSDDKPALRTILDDVCLSALADYYTDSRGRLAFVQIPDIDNASSVVTLAASDAATALSIERDLAPALSDQAMFQRNYAVHGDADVAGVVSGSFRAQLTREGSVNKLDAAGGSWPIHPFYKHALGAAGVDRLAQSVSNTPSESDPAADSWLIRAHRWYTKLRSFFSCGYDVSIARNIAPGMVCTLKADRFSLDAGRTVIVVSKSRRLLSPVIKLRFWG